MMQSEALADRGGEHRVEGGESGLLLPVEAGVFLIDKPVGPTSFTMVKRIRRALGIKKVGHAGTLDPFASGLLILCAGRAATRMIPHLMGGDKEYEATLKLGEETDTQDCLGRVISSRPVENITLETVHRVLHGFIGEQLQTPPRFSALKYKGKPLYYYARKGIDVEKAPRAIEIKSLNCLEQKRERITIRVTCSKGTYIRTLGADIGSALGCGAHLTALRRIRSGPFSITDALPGEALADPAQAEQILAANIRTVEQIASLFT